MTLLRRKRTKHNLINNKHEKIWHILITFMQIFAIIWHIPNMDFDVISENIFYIMIDKGQIVPRAGARARQIPHFLRCNSDLQKGSCGLPHW